LVPPGTNKTAASRENRANNSNLRATPAELIVKNIKNTSSQLLMGVVFHFYVCQKSQITIRCKKNRQRVLKESIARHTLTHCEGSLSEPEKQSTSCFKRIKLRTMAASE
jgi:hypothetical protein